MAGGLDDFDIKLIDAKLGACAQNDVAKKMNCRGGRVPIFAAW